MNDLSPRVLVLLVNYKNQADTIACIRSLHKSSYTNSFILVVDNASTDSSFSELGNFIEGSGVRNILLFRNQSNLGFAGGVNRGMHYALENGFDYVLLLNNDTVTSPDFIHKVVQTAEKDTRTGIVGAKILYYGGEKIYSAGGRISFLRNIGHLEHYGEKDSPHLTGEMNSSFISGCLMLIKASLIRDIGFLDESYFMYVEDVDFCFRAQKKGWNLKTNLDAIIWHKEGASSNSEFAAFWSSRNRLKFIFKNLEGIEKLKALFFHLASKLPLYCKIREPRFILADLKGMATFCRGLISGNSHSDK